jgi:hypothetical protein
MPAKLSSQQTVAALDSCDRNAARGPKTNVAVVLLPTLISLQTISGLLSIFSLGLLALLLFAAKPKQRYSIQWGPLTLFVAASMMVLIRPEPTIALAFFGIVVVILCRIIFTETAKSIIGSLIDGAGLYLLINVVAYAAGLRSAGSSVRVLSSIEYRGFVRTIFPLSWGLDAVPTVASVYLAAIAFVILQTGTSRRLLRLACVAAAMVVLILGASRAAIVPAFLLPVAILLFPGTLRWIAQACTLIASIFPLVFAVASQFIASVLQPLVELVPGRDSNYQATRSLNSRDYIWSRSLGYWWDYVTDFSDRVFGFGQGGQLHSGAWTAYGRVISVVTRDPQNASMHNAFLQQLFDGGLLGWLLLTASIFWASVRFSRHRAVLGVEGKSAIAAISALMLSAIPSVSVSPGASHQVAFWLLLILVGIACQAPEPQGVEGGAITVNRCNSFADTVTDPTPAVPAPSTTPASAGTTDRSGEAPLRS